MILKDKIIPIALVAALLGGTVGAIVSRKSTEPATAGYTTRPAGLFDDQNTRQISDTNQARTANQGEMLASRNETLEDPTSYRTGFLDGFLAGRDRNVSSAVTASTAGTANRVVVSRNVPAQRHRYASSSNGRQVYYDYNNTQPRKRSFWQKHRDKLTVAMGAGGGALLGSVIGGKKGASIGALAGGGGAALYTYKIRKRNRTY
jgi:hypothetical protein